MKELRKKIVYTILVLLVFRIGSFVPIPGVDIDKLAKFAEMANSGIFSMFNKFSGGAISRASVFALGIMPYITASIIIQLVVATTPELKKMKKEGGEKVQETFNQWTKYLTIVIGIGQALGFSTMLLSAGVNDVDAMKFRVLCVVTMLCGTFILIWFGNQITANGIGNGTSLIIFTGIVAEAPKDLMNLVNLSKNGNITPIEFMFVVGLFVLAVLFVIFFEKSNRLVYIQYPRQAMQMEQSQRNQMQNFLPLKVNPAGVIPPIFASSMLLLPATIASIFKNSDNGVVNFIMTNFTHGTFVFLGFSIVLIIFFSFFYNNVVFEPNEMAEQLRKSNIFVPGTRPGAPTAALFKRIMNRLSLIGGLYLCIICSVPELLTPKFGHSFFVGGTGLLIVINVITDTMAAIQSQLLPQKYQKNSKRGYR